MGSLVHHGPVAGVSGGLTGVAPGGRFRGNFFTVSGGKGRGDLRDPHRRQMGVVRRRWCPDVDEWRRRCVELGGRATRAWVERIDARARTVVWRRCSRAAFIGRGPEAGGRGVTGGGSVELQWRSRFGWGGNGEAKRGVRGEEQRRRFILLRERRGRRGGRSARMRWRRRRPVGLPEEEDGRVRRRRRADWAEKGGRRWAAVGLEKEGGGRAESIARAEIQNSKRKSILIDFWIKIGLEIE
jgi:hypothetical protein